MRRNPGFAVFHNAPSVLRTASAPHPFTGRLPGPMIAAWAMSLGSASVIVNALRLRGVSLQIAHERISA
jgi:Cu+-exporting ATPase